MQFFKKIVIIVLLFVSCYYLTEKFVLNKAPLLISFAQGMDNTSDLYFLALERVYKLSTNDTLLEKFKKQINGKYDKNTIDIDIRVIGVIGGEWAYNYIYRYFNNNYLSINSDKYLIDMIYSSMAISGDIRCIPLLEEMLDKQNNNTINGATIAASLYLITGNSNYQFINSSGVKQKLALDSNLIDARKVLANSMGRKRTLEEMIILDKTYRPPDDVDGYPLR